MFKPQRNLPDGFFALQDERAKKPETGETKSMIEFGGRRRGLLPAGRIMLLTIALFLLSTKNGTKFDKYSAASIPPRF